MTRLAVLGDIHGNLPALEAVLKAIAESPDIPDGYLILGDYYCDFPWHEHVAEILGNLPRTVLLAGNKEHDLADIVSGRAKRLDTLQFAPRRWAWENMTPKTRKLFLSLPDEYTDEEAGLFAAHAPDPLFGGATCLGRREMRSPGIRQLYDEGTPELMRVYRERVEAGIAADPVIAGRVDPERNDLYLYGHFHTQYRFEYGKSLLVNPGACGKSLDGDPRAGYAILECRGGVWHTGLFRAEYDREKTIRELRTSDMYAASPVWAEINCRETETGLNFLVPFFLEAQALAKARNEDPACLSDEVFREAAIRWLTARGLTDAARMTERL